MSDIEIESELVVTDVSMEITSDNISDFTDSSLSNNINAIGAGGGFSGGGASSGVFLRD